MAILKNDLLLLKNWDVYERCNPTKKDTKGYLWLHRGILAGKLKRSRLSERSLRNVVEQGSSFYAWSMLLDMYGKNQSAIGVL
jgi:hypothetical protein